MRFTRYSSLWIQSLIMWSHHWTNNSHYGQAKKTSFLHLYCNEWSIDHHISPLCHSYMTGSFISRFSCWLACLGLRGGQLAACVWSHFWSYSLCLLFSGSLTDLESSWTPADLQGAPACCCMCLINAHGENMRRYLLTVAHFNLRSMMWRHDSSKLLLPEETVWAQEREKKDQWNGFNLLSSVWCTVPVFHCLSFCSLLWFLMYKCLLLHLTNTSNILGPIKFYLKLWSTSCFHSWEKKKKLQQKCWAAECPILYTL